MNIKVELKGTTYNFDAWTVGKQKEVLLSLTDKEDLAEKIETYFDILVQNDSNFTVLEKLYILLQIRFKINGEKTEIRYKCRNCNNTMEGFIDITRVVYNHSDEVVFEHLGSTMRLRYNGELHNSIDIEGLPKEYNKDFLDTLSIGDYKYIDDIYRSIKEELCVNTSATCLLCKHENPIIIKEQELIDDYIIGMDLSTHYKLSAKFKRDFGFSIQETESLLPFEQEVYLSLYTEKEQ